MRRTLLFVLVGFLLAGCTADAYQRSADRQVQQILRDRKQTALGYQPETVVTAPVPTKPGAQAYQKIPATPLAPPTTSPIEPAHVDLPHEPLGPEFRDPTLPLPADENASGSDSLGIEAARERQEAQLELGPPAPGDASVRLDLFRAIEYAVEHSREYQTRMEDLYLAALDVTLARHLFEPRPFARTGLRYDETRNAQYRSALTATNSIGVRQQLPWGGDLTAQALVDFVNILNTQAATGESASLVLSGSMPLLRGFGFVNLEPLISSERELVYEVRDFEEFRRSFAVSVASRYFRLLSLQQSLANRGVNLAQRASLTERTQALYAAGRQSFLEVQRSLQAQLEAENRLILAQEQFQTQVDEFKVFLGMPPETKLEIVPVSLDVVVPDLDLERAMELAQQYRLSLQTAKDRLDDAQRRVQVAKNGLLPDLDLSGSATVSNEADEPAARIGRDNSRYSAEVSLDLPLDQVQERNEYRRSLIRLEQARRSLDSQRDTISVDVREAIRAIGSAQMTLRIQQRGIELARRRLENANELLRQGRVNARDVVEAQTDLLSAQDDYEEALSDLQIATLQYLRDTGTLRVDPGAGSLGRAMERDHQ